MFTNENQSVPNIFDINSKIGDKAGVVFDFSNNFHTIFHETFHFYQNSKNFYRKNTVGKTSFLPNYIVMSQLEQTYLAKALLANDKSEILENLKTFYVIRTEKYTIMSKAEIENEDTLESIEGTAEYVQQKLNSILKSQIKNYHLYTEPNYYDTMDSILFDTAHELSVDLNNDSLTRLKFYQTGFAMGMLFDKLGIKSWKTELENGKPFYNITKEIVKDYKNKNILTKIYNSDFYKNELERNTLFIADLQEQKEEKFANFMNSNGIKVVFQVSFDKVKNGITSKTRGESLYFGENGYLSLEGSYSNSINETVSFDIKGPYLRDYKIKNELTYTFFFDNMNDEFTLNGNKIDITKDYDFEGKVKISTTKFNFDLEKSTIKISKGLISIEVK